jgi:hypothetical protein
MSIDFCVAPNKPNTVTGPVQSFVFGIPWGDGVAWSDGAVFRIVAEGDSEAHEFAKGDGVASGGVLLFTFSEAQPGLRYRGLIADGNLLVEHFALADLCAIQHPADPCSHLPFPDIRDPLGTDPADDDTSGRPADDAPDPSTKPGDEAPPGESPSDRDDEAVAQAADAGPAISAFA